MIECTMNDELTEDKRPWYREPLVWLCISLPASAVIAGFYTLYLAIISYDGLVVDDYYKQGLTINKRIEKQRNATELGLTAGLQFNHEQNQLRLILTASEEFNYPEELEVVLSHATRQGYDQTLKAQLGEPGLYYADYDSLIQGKWNIMIETNDWRLLDTLFY